METSQRLALENVLEVPFLTNFRRRKRDLFFGNRSCNLYILAFPYLYDIADGLPADCGCFDILGLALGYFPPPVGLINLIFFFPISHRTTNTYLWSAAWEGGQPQRFYQKPFQYCCIHSPFKLHSSTTSIGGESSE